jgi:hypothetical protein
MRSVLVLLPAMAAIAAIGRADEFAAGLAAGETLPKLQGEFLTGRQAVLPQAAAGKVALLLLGFTYDSRFEVEAWAREFRREFEKNPNATFYEIPMIGGLARLGKWFIDSGMRRGTPEADREHVITVYRRTEEWKRRVGFKDPKAAYLLLLDSSGKIAWRCSAAFSEERYQALSQQVSRLLPGGLAPAGVQCRQAFPTRVSAKQASAKRASAGPMSRLP